ncbi:MAG: 16S rRNA (cytosine(967)-C(5))-methyltransferase RsmB [Ruminococcaceae bacterium]|nr:16S rRNA (cytosine(967)-C(5))-methyltransferase RsmB [Oscillospiraceae bacterium]
MILTVRRAAYNSLLRLEKEGRYSNLETDLTLKKEQLSQKDRALYTLLVYGVIERRVTLDYVLGQFSSKPIDDLDPEVRCLLRLGAYQILFCDRIPESAAVNESVKIANDVRRSASGYVNGVLRSLCKGKEGIRYPEKEKDPIAWLSVKYGYPMPMCELFVRDHGIERTASLFAAFEGNDGTTLRVNTLRITREELAQRLAERGIHSEKTPYSPHGLKVKCAVSELSELADGLCFVQDEASQLCATVLGAKPCETVIDTCSCPGGKSFSLAMEMQNEGKLYSFDLHANKLSLVRSGALRLGISIIETACRSGATYFPELAETADRMLMDLPCSGLGVMAKKPDLRFKNVEDIERLPAVQYAILDNSVRYLKKGGRLVVSTCTLAKAENEELIRKFLSEHCEFVLVPFAVGGLDAPSGMLQLYPDTHGTDGFFIALLEKK